MADIAARGVKEGVARGRGRGRPRVQENVTNDARGRGINVANPPIVLPVNGHGASKSVNIFGLKFITHKKSFIKHKVFE